MSSSDLHVTGLGELQAKLSAMESKTSQKALRSALMQSATPMVRKLRAAAPVGTRAHRTNRGRLVAPGFFAAICCQIVKIDPFGELHGRRCVYRRQKRGLLRHSVPGPWD